MREGGCRHEGDEYKRLLRQEELILDVTEALASALERRGVSRAELARRLNRTPGFVSQVLGGGRNLTLRTIADIAGALSVRASLKLRAADVSLGVDAAATRNRHEATHEIGHWLVRGRVAAPTSEPVDWLAESLTRAEPKRFAAAA